MHAVIKDGKIMLYDSLKVTILLAEVWVLSVATACLPVLRCSWKWEREKP